MKMRHVHRVAVIASICAAFVLYLCASLTDLTPIIFMILPLAVAAAYVRRYRCAAAYTHIKLKTQKAE
jgi:ABC-type iron transport system FetAB permease component